MPVRSARGCSPMRHLPEWHKEPEEVRVACKQAADHCAAQGVDIAQLAVQYCVAHPDISTTIAGSANPDNVRNWAKWAKKPRWTNNSSPRCWRFSTH